MSSPAATYAGTLAALYADPSDAAFAASGIEPPTLRDLTASMLRALDCGDRDTAEALSYEVARIVLGGRDEPLLRGSSGLWRVH